MEMIKNYIIKHWEGGFSLRYSFWVNSVLIPIMIYIPLMGLLFSPGPDGIPRASFIGLAFFSFVAGALSVWVNIGLWKCCNTVRETAGKPKFWANVVQWLIMIGLAISALNAVVSFNIINGFFLGVVIYMLYQIGRAPSEIS